MSCPQICTEPKGSSNKLLSRMILCSRCYEWHRCYKRVWKEDWSTFKPSYWDIVITPNDSFIYASAVTAAMQHFGEGLQKYEKNTLYTMIHVVSASRDAWHWFFADIWYAFISKYYIKDVFVKFSCDLNTACCFCKMKLN